MERPQPAPNQAHPPPPAVVNNRDLQVHTKGLRRSLLGDAYYSVMVTTWPRFFAGAVVIYLCVNAGFATLYYFGGDTILNARPGSYIDAYLFSFQTSTTIGYGYLLPKTGYTHAVVMLDVFSGLIFVATLTGLVFARFARPRASVLFSKNVLISRHQGKPALIFRVANDRKSYIVNARVNAVILMQDSDPSSVIERRFYDVQLQRSQAPIFALTWTLVHFIDEQSPLFGLQAADLQARGAILIVSLDGIEDLLAQTVHTRHLYATDEFVFGKRFVDIVTSDQNGARLIDYTRFHDLVDLPSA